MTDRQRIRVDIVSDVMCPWCYVGKRRFARALQLVPEFDVEVGWRPFQLDPTLPAEGIERREYLERKFRDPERIAAMHDALVEAGAAEGIPFAFDRIARASNTLDAHRLILWASASGAAEAMAERLFALYFTEGADIGDRRTLSKAAASLGMRADRVAMLLAGDTDRETVKRDITRARQIGITSVPTFIVAGKYAVVGAEAPAFIAETLRVAAGELAGTTGPETTKGDTDGAAPVCS
ncbi:MAG TPA: DsbA family oxidoreductase [Hyphomicrobiales bacterium]|nr:DsbA family oxidoreductase [Kaistiaceae bacterium]HQF31670.1 DsbA family oxidoreductase [Hyphomicrobiales bacterium]